LGRKGVGKSFLANIIGANTDFLNDNTIQNEVFSTAAVDHNDIYIDCFITKDRIILLDTSPLLTNLKRDMINSELDDIKIVQILINCCHLLITVNDGFLDLSVSRLLNQAEQFSSEFKHRPFHALIGNKIKTGNKFHQIDRRIYDANDVLFIPDLNSPSVDFDIPEIIQRFQEIVFMKKRFSMTDDEEDVFTELKWYKRLESTIEKLKKEKGDFFLRKFEALKDKFHQSIEN
jgi:hypothetical protein